MIKRFFYWVILIYVGVFILPGSSMTWGQEVAQENGGTLRWGGPGYDAVRIKGSTRFAAEIGKIADSTGKTILKIRVDSKETWEDLEKLSLTSEDGKVSVTSKGRGKYQRHITAAWVCIFSAEEIKQLPDEGLIVAWDSNGKQLLSEKADFRPLKGMLATGH
jgi:hypothetical protein